MSLADIVSTCSSPFCSTSVRGRDVLTCPHATYAVTSTQPTTNEVNRLMVFSLALNPDPQPRATEQTTYRKCPPLARAHQPSAASRLRPDALLTSCVWPRNVI